MDNNGRAEKAWEIARGYSDHYGRPEPDCDIRDLICDLLHAARKLGLDPITEWQTAKEIFEQEESEGQ